MNKTFKKYKEFIAPLIMMIGVISVIVIHLTCDGTENYNSPDEVHTVCGVENKAKGIDVSYYQATIDWDIVASDTDIEFGVARISDGTQKIDPKFEENWKEMKRVGIIRGAYQFFRPNQNAIEQAELFLKLLDEAGGLEDNDLPPTLDIEVTGGATSDQITAGMYDWLEFVQAYTNRIPIIYTGPAFFEAAKLDISFSKYPLWTAHYTERPCPWVPNNWNHWEIWQYTGSGTLAGIYRPVDINVFNGDTNALQRFIEMSNTNLLSDENKDCLNDASTNVLMDVNETTVKENNPNNDNDDDEEPKDEEYKDASVDLLPPNVGCQCSSVGIR